MGSVACPTLVIALALVGTVSTNLKIEDRWYGCFQSDFGINFSFWANRATFSSIFGITVGYRTDLQVGFKTGVD